MTERQRDVNWRARGCGGENYIETVWGRGYVLRDIDGEGNEVRRVA